MPHERQRRLAHPSSPSFHTSPALKSAVARVYLGLLIFISNLLSQRREFVEWEDQRVAVTCVRRGWERRVPIFTSGTNPNSVISRFRSGILGITHLHLKFAFASAAGSAEKKTLLGGRSRGPLWARVELCEPIFLKLLFSRFKPNFFQNRGSDEEQTEFTICFHKSG